MWTKKIGFLDLSVSARSWGVYIPDGVLAFRDRPPGQTDAEAINDCINAAIDLRLKDETAARDDIAALQMLPERVSMDWEDWWDGSIQADWGAFPLTLRFLICADRDAFRLDVLADRDFEGTPTLLHTQPVVSIEAGKTAAEDFRGNWLRRSGVIR